MGSEDEYMVLFWYLGGSYCRLDSISYRALRKLMSIFAASDVKYEVYVKCSKKEILLAKETE